MGIPAIDYSAPKNPAQPLAAVRGKGNPYLTSSDYQNMQLHTPSGLYYNNGKVYEPYKVGTKQVAISGGMSPFGGYNPMMGGGFGGRYNTVPDVIEGSITSGDQYFKPFTGNAAGIINGDLSMVYGLGNKATPAYTPQPLPDLFPSLNLLQSESSGSMEGAGRFLGNNLLGSPIVTSNT